MLKATATPVQDGLGSEVGMLEFCDNTRLYGSVAQCKTKLSHAPLFCLLLSYFSLAFFSLTSLSLSLSLSFLLFSCSPWVRSEFRMFRSL
jgi:hypothetical protein